MKKRVSGLLAVLAATSLAGAVGAQVCVGLPTVDRQFTVGGFMIFPDGADVGDVWGVEGSANPVGPLSFFGAVTFFSDDGITSFGRKAYGGGAAWEITPAAPIAVCPTVSVEYMSLETLGTALAVPVGIGLGVDLPVTARVGFSPYLVPAVIWSRFDPDDGFHPGEDTESQVDFGMSGGVLVSFGSFFVDGTVQHVFDGESDPVFGFRAGVRL